MELERLIKIIAREDKNLLEALREFALATDGETQDEEDTLDLLMGSVLDELENE